MSIRVNAGTDRIRRTANLPNCNSYTQAGWAKRIVTNAGTFRTILDANSPGKWSSLQWESSNDFMVTCNHGPGGLSDDFSVQPATGEWFYCAITGSAAGVIGYWWNAAGVLQDIATCGPGSGFSFVPTNVDCMSNAVDEYMDGVVAYGRLWDVALSQAELEAEMFSPTPVRTANLNTAFTGVSGSGADVSGNGRNWTLTGVTADADEPPVVFPSGSFTFVIPGRRVLIA